MDIANSISWKNTGTRLGWWRNSLWSSRAPAKNCDITRWGQFTDIKDIKEEMLMRIEVYFEKWLNP